MNRSIYINIFVDKIAVCILLPTIIYSFSAAIASECDFQFLTGECVFIGESVVVECVCQEDCEVVFLKKNDLDVDVNNDNVYEYPDGCGLQYTFDATAADDGAKFKCGELHGGTTVSYTNTLTLHVYELLHFDGICSISVSSKDLMTVNVTLSFEVIGFKHDCSGHIVQIYFEDEPIYSHKIESILWNNGSISMVINVPTTEEFVANVLLIDNYGIIHSTIVECENGLATSSVPSIGLLPVASSSPTESSGASTVPSTMSDKGDTSRLSASDAVLIAAAVVIAFVAIGVIPEEVRRP